MRTDEDTNIISIAKVINEEEHAEDAKKALEKKAKEKVKNRSFFKGKRMVWRF